MANSLTCFLFSFFSLIIYAFIFRLFYKKRNHCFIKFNSFSFLIIISTSLYILNLIIIYSDKERIIKRNYPKILILLFELSRTSFFLAFILRMGKIIQSINLSNDLINSSRKKASIFYSKRYSLMDNFYVKIFCFFLIIFGIILIIKFYNNIEHYNFIPYLTEIPGEITIEKISLLKFNAILIFFKSIIIVTILYNIIFLPNLKKNIKIILSLENLFYLLYFQMIYFTNVLTLNQTLFPQIIFYLFEIIQMVLQVVIPLYMNRSDNMLITTVFNPKLVSDFYLFVSDEICYYSFSNFLNSSEINKFLLQLYIEIMKFKFKYSLEAEYNNVVYEAKKIYNKYFDKNSKTYNYLNEEILNNVRKSCEMIDKGQCNYEMFDSLLVNVYEILRDKFYEFQKTEEYKILVQNINMNSYIQYKVLDMPNINAKPLNFI